MPGPRWVRLAQRIHAYGGAVAALIRTELDEQRRQPGPTYAAPAPPPTAPPQTPSPAPGTTYIGATRAELMMSEELAGLISFGTA